MAQDVTILCLASYYKGTGFLEKASDLGAHVILVVAEEEANQAWPSESIDERFVMPDLTRRPDIIHAISYLARDRRIDRIIPLDDYDVETAASLREHLRLPGIGESQVRYFRDKLAMRIGARDLGLPVPAFTPVFDYERLHAWMQEVPPPWVLKPRSEAGAMGIKKVNHPNEVWQQLDALGDQQSFFLLEDYVPGEVYHTDSLVVDGKVRFAVASKYGRPPLDVSHSGGVFMTRLLPEDDEGAQTILEMNRKLQEGLGLERGAAHTEFIKGEDGQFYFLETAARVGGANIHLMIRAATGIDLWEEWAAAEMAHARGEQYTLPERSHDYAGLLVCLARQEWPDMSNYDEPEVVWRLHKPQHAGLIVKAENAGTVKTLLEQYSRRFAEDFLAVAPPLETGRPGAPQ
ncbi:MAG: ATP-grasp domain-containing protein [Candidatus Promineifilaceae bacterium]|nr:ATP-grasp domain-containing protein [Candidatus Promineifilaceae bacterium]